MWVGPSANCNGPVGTETWPAFSFLSQSSSLDFGFGGYIFLDLIIFAFCLFLVFAAVVFGF